MMAQDLNRAAKAMMRTLRASLERQRAGDTRLSSARKPQAQI
jgi:hypothetical protein